MGTTGTGRFHDYSTPLGGAPKGDKKGPDDISQCERRIENSPLEDVANCDYYRGHGLPESGTPVRLRQALVEGRLAIETADGGKVLGYMPTQYNYLRQCMEQGYSYLGRVTSCSEKPIPSIRVDLEPGT